MVVVHYKNKAFQFFFFHNYSVVNEHKVKLVLLFMKRLL